MYNVVYSLVVLTERLAVSQHSVVRVYYILNMGICTTL